MEQATEIREGERAPDFAEENNLVVTNSLFLKAADTGHGNLQAL